MYRCATIVITGVFALFTSGLVIEAQPGQPQAGQKGSTPSGQQGWYYGGISQTPWFASPDIRQQFKLTDAQYNQLNKSYADSYTRYRQDMNVVGKDLTPEQRAQKTTELNQRFNKDFSKTVNEVFTDPQQQQRYNQLYLQYQGYNAFMDPQVQQKLNLTPSQREKLTQQSQQWQKQMSDLGRTYQSDREGASTKYNDLRKQYGENINTILTPDQQKSWQQMTGKSYNFQPNVYFQTNSNSSTTNPNPSSNNKR